jgi:hypothetical protein
MTKFLQSIKGLEKHTPNTHIAALFKLVGFAAALFNSLSHFQ